MNYDLKGVFRVVDNESNNAQPQLKFKLAPSK